MAESWEKKRVDRKLSTLNQEPSTNALMNEPSVTAQPVTPLPPDDLARTLKVARPDTAESLPHIGLVGDTYTILLSGADTDGRYCLIDMHIPPGGGIEIGRAHV